MIDPASHVNLIFDIDEQLVDARTTFRSNLTRHLHEWWAGVPNGPPRRKDFDITEHPSLAANIFVVECRPDGDFVFRLLGDEVIHIIGRNRTGEVLKPGAVGEYGHGLFDYYTRVARIRACMKCIGYLKFQDSNVARFESIDCPLIDDDGSRVSRIIGVMDTLEPAALP
jgi:hypothetical protein